MNTPAVKVEGLSKRYRIGVETEKSDTLVGAFTSWVRQPLKKYRELRRLSQFNEEEADDIIWAVDDVSFDISQGEVVGLIGHNGAGKSTLLKLLSRITEPTRGRAVLEGRVSSLLEVGTGFHEELTGRENMYLNGTILGMSKSEVDAKFDQIVEFSGVEKFLDTPVKRYSSGMKVRLGFAVAAHLDPEILLIDEVLAVGDAAFQKRCLGKMKSVAQSGRTVLFVSHDMGAMARLTSRCILLKDGKVDMIGPTENVIDRYLRETVYDESFVNTFDEGGMRKDSGFAFTYIRLLDADGTEGLREGDPIHIEIGYRAHASIKDIHVGVGINSKNGERIISTYTRDNDLSFDISPGEEGAVRLRLNGCRLAAGSYLVSIGAGSGHKKNLAYLAEALMLDITPDLQDAWSMHSRGLGLRTASTWSLTSPDESLSLTS